MPRDETDVDTTRLEAFSDGVIAIIVTIMVLELKPPRGVSGAELFALWPTFFSYALSFLIVAIYWVNHRHVVRYATRVTPLFLWLNLLTLFAISLIPIATAWLGDHLLAPAPNVAYGGVLIFAGVSFLVMQEVVNRQNAHRSELAPVIRKARLIGAVSVCTYAVGAALSFVLPGAMLIAAGITAVLYFVPIPAGAAPSRG